MKPTAWKFGVAILGCAAIIAVVFVIRAKSKSSVDQDLAAIHAMGFPVNRTEFHSLAPTAGTDAWPLYDKYIQDLRKLSGPQKIAYANLTSFGTPVGAPSDWEKQANDLRPILNPLLAGSEQPRVTIPDSDASDKLGWEAVFLLPNIAVADSEAGNIDRALTYLHASNGILIQLSKLPSWNMGTQSDATLDAYRKILGLARKEPAVLQRMINEMHSLPAPMNARWQAMEGFLEDLELYEKPQLPVDPGKGETQRLIENAVKAPSLKHDAQVEIAMWKDAFARLPKDPTDYRGVQNAMYAAYAIAHPGVTPSWKDSTMISTAQLLNEYPKVVARRRLVAAAGNLLIIRLRTGSYPKSLPPGTDSIDPVTGKPFTYKHSASGFDLYNATDMHFDISIEG